MLKITEILLIVLFTTCVSFAQQDLPSQVELAKKPMYERMLGEEDAEKVADIGGRVAASLALDQVDEAVKHQAELVEYRTQRQGADHWEVVRSQLALDTLRKLNKDQRRQYAEASQARLKGRQFYSQSLHAKAQPFFQKAIDIYIQVLGKEHPETAISYNDLGLSLNEGGNFAEAERMFREAISIYKGTLGENHPYVANGYNNLALSLDNLGKSSEARVFFEKAVDIASRVLGEEHLDTVSFYSNLAVNLMGLGKSVEAQQIEEKVLEVRRRILGEDHQLTALSYNNLAGSLQKQGKMYEAKLSYEKASQIFVQVLKEDHPYIATIYGNIASCLSSMGKYDEAQVLTQKSLEILRGVHGENHPDTALTYSQSALILQSQGRFAEAQAVAQKSIEICRKVLGENNPQTLICYNNLATNLQHQGKNAEAKLLLQQGLDKSRELQGDDHAETATSYLNLASNLYAQMCYFEAQPYFQRALDINIVALGPKHPSTAYSYNGLAMNMLAQGKAAEAQSLIQSGLEIQLDLLGEEHPKTAQFYNNLADTLEHQGLMGEAEGIYRKSLSISRLLNGENHPITTAVYYNLANNLYSKGQLPETISILEKAAQSAETSRLNRADGIERSLGENYNPRSLMAVIKHTEQPDLAWKQQELTLARGLLDQQTTGVSKLSEQEVINQASWQSQLAELQPRISALFIQRQRSSEEQDELNELIAKRDELAQRIAELTVELSARVVASASEIQSAIPSDGAMLLWVDISSRSGHVQEHFVCVVRHKEDPFWMRLPGTGEQGKWTKDDSLLPSRLREALSQKIPPNKTADLIKQVRRQRVEPVLDHLQQHGIKQLFVVGIDTMAGLPVEVLAPEFAISYIPSGTYLARLPRKPNYENSLLAVGDPVYEIEKAPVIELTALPPNGLLVQEVIATGAGFEAGIRSGDVLLQYGQMKLDQVDQLRSAIQMAAEAGETTASVTVWRVDQENKTLEKTVSLPVGPLGVILDLQPAPTALAEGRKAESILASVRRGEQWQDLPGSRFEVSRISQMFPTAKVLLDSEANERSVDALRMSGELGQYRYLHFATHGKGNDSMAFESKLVLSQNSNKEELATADRPWINNEITAREVLEHWKLNADLVTLSACETGLGQSGAGDGLLGFAQAFLLSGARTVCLSLWEVDDTATALLMHRFYQNLLGKRPGVSAPMRKVDALREAKTWLQNLSNEEASQAAAMLLGGISRGERGEIQVRERIKADKRQDKPFADPYYWSAFILIGDSE